MQRPEWQLRALEGPYAQNEGGGRDEARQRRAPSRHQRYRPWRQAARPYLAPHQHSPLPRAAVALDGALAAQEPPREVHPRHSRVLAERECQCQLPPQQAALFFGHDASPTPPLRHSPGARTHRRRPQVLPQREYQRQSQLPHQRAALSSGHDASRMPPLCHSPVVPAHPQLCRRLRLAQPWPADVRGANAGKHCPPVAQPPQYRVLVRAVTPRGAGDHGPWYRPACWRGPDHFERPSPLPLFASP